MKKKIILFIMGLFIFTIPANAKNEEFSTSVTEVEINLNEVYKKDRFKDIINYSDSTLEIENPNNSTTIYYKTYKNSDGSAVRHGEWFKLVDGKQINYKETFETGYITDNEKYFDFISSREFYVDKNKCKNSSDIFVNNQCQGNLKQVDFYVKVGNKVLQKIQLSYINKNTIKENMYNSITIKSINNGKLTNYIKVVGTRDTNNIIKSVSQYSYDEKGKIEQKRQSIKINYRQDKYDILSVSSFGVYVYDYDEGRLYRKAIEREYENNFVNTYEVLYERFANGKVKYSNVIKRNSSDKIYYNRMYKFNKKGIRKGLIVYSYKNGKKTLRKEYIYNNKKQLKSNKNGKAYRYTTTYNSKQKAVKTYRQKYNSKGKLAKKKYKVKHRNDYLIEDRMVEEIFFF